MDKSVMFYLLVPTQTQDTMGDWETTLTKRPVYGSVSSVTANEFFAGGQNGYSPEIKVTMFGPDYEGEENLELDGVQYSIYRVYRGRTDTAELYCERRRGDG
jgi:hypothetical protein